jgi:DNA-binding IclR family transcriptional regulator
MDERATEPGTINSVNKALRILEEMQDRNGCRVNDLSDSLQLPASTVYKYLKTLEVNGYIQKNDGVYTPSYRFLKLGGHARDQSRIFQFGRQKVENLAEEINELVFISILDGQKGVFVFRANDQYNIQDSLPLGKRFYLHQNASGKAMLAKLSDDQIETIIENQGLPAATEATITSKADLMEELAEIRAQGYALNRGERDSTLMAVSSAVIDTSNNEVGAIGISFPRESPASELIDDEYARAVQRVSSKLTHQLRHS